MEILEYTNVLSDLKIQEVQEKIMSFVQESDPYDDSCDDVDNDIQFAFGKFINGVCLIYLHESQQNFDELNHLMGTASFAIDKNGNFISIECNKHNFNGLELNQYDSINDLTLTDFGFERILKYKDSDINTDNFLNWSWNKKLEFTDNIIYHAGYQDGYVNFYSDFDDVNSISEEDVRNTSGILCLYASNLIYLYKGDISYFTNILVSSRLLLLRSQEEYKEYEDNAGFGHCFSDLLIDDVYKPRYGLFDLYKQKTIIHCGERECNGGYINGFVRLEIKNSSILTYDKFDIEKGIGIPYSSTMEKPKRILVNSPIIDLQKYLPVNIIEEPYMYSQGYRMGRHAGPLYIIREGEYAGRNISWLKNSDFKTLIRYLRSGYLHINEIKDFAHDVYGEEKDRLWLANDLHYVFEEITNPLDCLYISDISSSFYMCETKHEHERFEDIIGSDPKYLVELIKSGCIHIDFNVFEDIRIMKDDDSKYMKKLNLVESAMRDVQVKIDQYEEECEERIRDAEESYWEEEERRYYENEGYRSAFDNDPEAEWNID